MTNEILGMIMIGVMLFAIFIGFPISFTLIFLGSVFGLIGFGNLVFYLMTFQFSSVMLEQTLAAVPLFIFMGILMEQAGLMERLFQAVQLMLSRVRGALFIAVLFVSTIFAAATGIVGASVTILGIMAAKTMNRSKYDVKLAAGTITAGGTLGILIPPSVLLVLYGILTNTDIGKLFIAGILPGLISIASYFVVIDVMTRLKPELGPRGERMPLGMRFRSLTKVWGVVALFLFVLGGIYVGFVTPVEAGGVGAAGALLFAVGRRVMSFAAFRDALAETIRTSAMLFFVIFGAQILSAYINAADLPGQMLGIINGLELSAAGVLTIIIMFYIGFGCVFSAFALVLLTVPVFFPLIVGLGLDVQFDTSPENVLIWFGIVIVVVAEIGQITPHRHECVRSEIHASRRDSRHNIQRHHPVFCRRSGTPSPNRSVSILDRVGAARVHGQHPGFDRRFFLQPVLMG